MIICLCFSLAVFCAQRPDCRAQDHSGNDESRTLHVRFINLKPDNTIAPSCLTLQPDKKLGFSIDETSLANVQGTWSQGRNSFSAQVAFTVDKQTSFHYRLEFEGYRLKNLYGGRAYLREYDRRERLLQKIDFLFYAVPPGTLAGSEKDNGK